MNPGEELQPLRPGDHLYILVKGKSAFTANVVNVDGNTFLVEEMSVRGKGLSIKQFDPLDIFFYREDGIYSFKGIANETVNRYGVRMIRISASGEPLRKQRRAYHRLQKNLPVSITLNVDKNHVIRSIDIKAHTMDISAGGSRIVLPEPIEKDAGISCRITLDDNRDLNLNSVVVRVIDGDSPDKTPQIGVKFTDMDERTRQELVKFIDTEQQRLTAD